jgi:hypothetical protein
MSAKQSEVFQQLSETFSPEAVSNWEAMVTAWNMNPKAPNPYAEPKSCRSNVSLLMSLRGPNFSIDKTLQDVRLELAMEEAARAGLGILPRHKISMATFLLTGFELEDSQYVETRFI